MGQKEAMLQWNVLEFVKEVTGLPEDEAGMWHEHVPGGETTIEEAVKQGLVVITYEDVLYNYYELTQKGLELIWEHSDDKEGWISRKVT